MSKAEIREPRQTRAIEKKKKIAEAGFKLFCEKGFHHTNTNEIAKEAGVSTGILYHYFKDKKAILLAVMDQVAPKFDANLVNELHLSKDINELKVFLSYIIDKNVHLHSISKEVHEEFQAMMHSDPDVAEYMKHFNDEFLSSIANALPSLGFNISHPHEKVDMIYHMIDQYSDGVAINNRAEVNYDDMKKLLIETILSLLNLDV